MTNYNDPDLRDKEQVERVLTHYHKKQLKSCIKPFTLPVAELTGLENFDQLSKDPLAIPTHGLEISEKAQPKAIEKPKGPG